MKFRNNTGAPIYISYKVRGSRMTATLFGKGPAPKTSINVVSRTLGEREKKAQLFRVVRKDGKIVSRERVGSSHYKWKEDDPEMD
jgi:vancomycin resistance protein YoaR